MEGAFEVRFDFELALCWPLLTLAIQSQDVSLTDYKGKWLVLFFYPMDVSLLHLGAARRSCT